MFAQVREEVYDVVYSSRYTVDEVHGTSYAGKKTLNVKRNSSRDEKYLQFITSIFSLLEVFYHKIPSVTGNGTIGKVYRLLPQAGAGVTVYRQVGSVNALTGGHSPSPNSLPG